MAIRCTRCLRSDTTAAYGEPRKLCRCTCGSCVGLQARRTRKATQGARLLLPFIISSLHTTLPNALPCGLKRTCARTPQSKHAHMIVHVQHHRSMQPVCTAKFAAIMPKTRSCAVIRLVCLDGFGSVRATKVRIACVKERIRDCAAPLECCPQARKAIQGCAPHLGSWMSLQLEQRWRCLLGAKSAVHHLLQLSALPHGVLAYERTVSKVWSGAFAASQAPCVARVAS